ncbi:hypothetical protein R3P38DRAFT_3194826 [Favolaschia claudopus]|uniref:F-box domain-containing protein n=1 Tax=Favolaschia claudopus TaxID=2862362 RepID=A0AAW0BDC8_9AGAR
MHHIFTQASSFRRAPNVMSRKDFHQHAWNRFQSQGLVDAETRPGVIGLTSEKKSLTLEAFKQAVILKHVAKENPDYPNSTQPAEPPGRVVHDSWSTVPHTLATRGQGTVRMLCRVDKAFDKCYEDSLLCPPESAFAGLPVELIIYIFHLFLDAFHPPGLSYRSGRCTLLLVSRFWHRIIVADGSFWRTFVVTPETTPQTIAHTLQATSAQSLSVFLLDLRPQNDSRTADDRAVLLSSFRSILPTAFRWVGLEIFSFSTLTMQALADHAIRQGIPALRRFAVQSHARHPISMPLQLSSAVQSANLHDLVLHGVHLPGLWPSPTPELRSISLSDIPSRHAPNGRQLLALLACSNFLTSIELSRVGVCGDPVPLFDFSRVVLPSLTSLTLAFDSRNQSVNSLLEVLQYVDVPRLLCLNLSFANDRDLELYVTAAIAFSAPSVSVSGVLRSPSLVARLFLTFETVEKLDLVGTGERDILVSLGDRRRVDNNKTAVVLPRLRHLRVLATHWEALYESLLSRSSRGSVLESLELIPLGGPLDDTALDKYSEIRDTVHCVSWGHRTSLKGLTNQYPTLEAVGSQTASIALICRRDPGFRDVVAYVVNQVTPLEGTGAF